MATVKTIRAFYAPSATWHSPYQQYFGQFCVEIKTTCGKLGLGVGGGGLASIEIVNRALAPLLQGTKAEPSEGIWDQMHDTCSPYGQKGIAIMAISAVDLALWDLKGKIEGLPVCDLISSGSSERRIKVYITTNDIERNLELGFDAFKITPIAGPGDGEIGKSRNVEYVRKVRDKLGAERKLMLDCWMSWTVDYTVEMAKRLSSFKLDWIEEPLAPDDYSGYRKLKKEVAPTKIATGEHEYTRFGFRVLSEFQAADIFQPDVTWCGGLTEAIRIANEAQANGTRLVLHRGGEVWGLHLSAALNLELVELADPKEFPSFPLLRGQPTAVDGFVQPTSKPGFGVEWT